MSLTLLKPSNDMLPCGMVANLVFGCDVARSAHPFNLEITDVETAKLHGVDPAAYMAAAVIAAGRGEVLLPWDFAPAR
jgi:hypothetical protein